MDVSEDLENTLIRIVTCDLVGSNESICLDEYVRYLMDIRGHYPMSSLWVIFMLGSNDAVVLILISIESPHSPLNDATNH